MARSKAYKEEEVLEKAMDLFWRVGYETTSMNMLEKEMGINKFSIYSSFGSKKGVFLESVKCYRTRLAVCMDKLKKSQNGVEGIKQYFYDFIDFSNDSGAAKGCLVTNTANQLNPDADAEIKEVLSDFTNSVRNLFLENLKQESDLKNDSIENVADYLIVSIFGLSSASRVFNKAHLENYIENIFKNI
ncbi:TetR/AcrR family transcriptional regulator [Portibacter lacus]|uniref:TetR family transcriptional regulator n=1 Tax=Portibacter lacus TaxID=1099794 RepID=A0AA37SPU5_9BACT|nr:TetR/AcrR family transcriptional regulator [Portibacter lacus]GLR17302.1 TetR family transcriptional regulator [Portibacter lacus]